MKNKEYYHGTIAWDGYDEDSMGEQTILRYSLDHLIEDLIEYLEKFKTREPYIECASYEANDQEQDITESVKKYIETINKRG